jgi:hypothetical protein
MLERTSVFGHKRSGPRGVTSTRPALEHTLLRRSRAMSRSGHYTPLGAILNREHSEAVREVRA